MKSIIRNYRITALVGILIFTNAFGQSGIEIPKQEIPEEYEFIEEVEGKDWDECNKKINSKYFNSKLPET